MTPISATARYFASAFGLTGAPAPGEGSAVSQEGDADSVILLHGLSRSESSLVVLERMLEAAGYRPVNVGYSSQKPDISGLTSFISEAYVACGSNRSSAGGRQISRPSHEAGIRRDLHEGARRTDYVSK